MNPWHDDQRISAYLDGELSADEQARFEEQLAASAALRQLVDELRSLRGSLELLPRHRLGEDFAQRVLRRAERELLGPDLGSGGFQPPIVDEITSQPADPLSNGGPAQHALAGPQHRAADRHPAPSAADGAIPAGKFAAPDSKSPGWKRRGLRPLVYAAIAVAAAVLISILNPAPPKVKQVAQVTEPAHSRRDTHEAISAPGALSLKTSDKAAKKQLAADHGKRLLANRQQRTARATDVAVSGEKPFAISSRTENPLAESAPAATPAPVAPTVQSQAVQSPEVQSPEVAPPAMRPREMVPRAMAGGQIAGSPAPLGLRESPTDVTVKDANTLGKSGAKPLGRSSPSPAVADDRALPAAAPDDMHTDFAANAPRPNAAAFGRPASRGMGAARAGVGGMGAGGPREGAMAAGGRAGGGAASALPAVVPTEMVVAQCIATPEVAEGAFDRLLAKNGIVWSNASENEIIPRATENLAVPKSAASAPAEKQAERSEKSAARSEKRAAHSQRALHGDRTVVLDAMTRRDADQIAVPRDVEIVYVEGTADQIHALVSGLKAQPQVFRSLTVAAAPLGFEPPRWTSPDGAQFDHGGREFRAGEFEGLGTRKPTVPKADAPKAEVLKAEAAEAKAAGSVAAKSAAATQAKATQAKAGKPTSTYYKANPQPKALSLDKPPHVPASFAAPAHADEQKGSAAEIAKPALASTEKSPPAAADKSGDAALDRKTAGQKSRGAVKLADQNKNQAKRMESPKQEPTEMLRAAPHAEPPGAAASAAASPRAQGAVAGPNAASPPTAGAANRDSARRNLSPAASGEVARSRPGSPATGRALRLKLLYETDSARPPSKGAEEKPATNAPEGFGAARPGGELLGDRAAGSIQPKLPTVRFKGAATGATEQSAGFAAQRLAGRGRELAAPRMQAIFVFRRAAPVAQSAAAAQPAGDHSAPAGPAPAAEKK